MYKVTLLSLLIFSFGIIVNADYSVSNYDPSYTPYNLQSAIDHGNCDDELEVFDSKYKEIRERYIEYKDGTWAGSSAGQTVLQGNRAAANEINEIQTAFELNDLESEDAIAECLENRQTKAEEDASRERRQAREEAAQRYEEEKKAKIQQALNECDLEYFETLSNDDKMATYDERKACEDKASESETVEIIPTSAPVPEPVAIEPVVPEYVSPAPAEQVDPVPESEPEINTEETIEITQEELDQIVEEKLNEKLEEVDTDPEPQVEEKPSFFKRVTNFLFGWML